MQRADVVVLGGGPAGYPAAVRLAQEGKRVVLVEPDSLGGTCLNRGCIPTKVYVAGASLLRAIRSSKQFGIDVGAVSFDWQAMVHRKEATVARLRSGLRNLLEATGVKILSDKGRLVSAQEVELCTSKQKVSADHIIIATGSRPKPLASIPFDWKIVHCSTSILDIQKIPASIVIVGGGAIGCEFASLFATFGSRVFLVELLPRILPLECEAVSAAVAQGLQRQGVEVLCGVSVESSQVSQGKVAVMLSDGKEVIAEMALVAAGRALNTDDIGLSVAKVAVNKGAVVVDDKMATNVPRIWAVGDVTAKSLCAHVATHQGLIAAENILGNVQQMRYDAIPGGIFTDPEVGSVGMTLENAKQQGYVAKSYLFPFQALGKGQVMLETEGFVQTVVEEKTGRILGAQAVGNHASELIAEMTAAVANEIPIECVGHTIHAHPTFAEAWLEVAMIAQGKPINFPKSSIDSVKRG